MCVTTVWKIKAPKRKLELKSFHYNFSSQFSFSLNHIFVLGWPVKTQCSFLFSFCIKFFFFSKQNNNSYWKQSIDVILNCCFDIKAFHLFFYPQIDILIWIQTKFFICFQSINYKWKYFHCFYSESHTVFCFRNCRCVGLCVHNCGGVTIVQDACWVFAGVTHTYFCRMCPHW